MTAVATLWRNRFRNRWRTWATLAVLLGLGTGAGLACLAGARRTASSYERIAEATDYPDIVSSHLKRPAAAVRTAEAFDGVAGHSTQVGFGGQVDGLDSPSIKFYIGSWDAPLVHGRPVIRDGRFSRPDRVDEVMVIGKAAAGLVPGDHLRVKLFTSDFADSETFDVVVTGTGEDAADVAADSSHDRSAMYFTPAFTRTHAARFQVWSSTRLVADPGIDPERDLAPQLIDAGWPHDETASSLRERVQDAIRPLVITLTVLAVLVLVATFVVIAQAITRQSDADRDDREAARAMGLTRRQALALDSATVLSIGVPGVLLGAAVAVLLSPLFPAGSVRAFEPNRGVDVDLVVLSLGAIGTVVFLLLADQLTARGSNRPVRSVGLRLPGYLTGSRPSIGAGLRLAAGGTTRQRRRFWTTVAMSAGGLALLVAGIVFVGALDRVSAEPRRYGVGWELTARNAYGEVPTDEVRALVAGDSDIEGIAGAGYGAMRLDGVGVPGLPILPITAELWPTVVDGSVPRNDDEVIVGSAVLDELDAEIGDTVSMQAQDAPGDRRPAGVTIVGTAVFPSIEIAGTDPTRLDHGVAMTWPRFQSLGPAEITGDEFPDITLFDLADGVDPDVVIDRYRNRIPELNDATATEWLTTLAPAEVVETDRATGLIWTVVALLTVTVLATIGHTLIGAVRRRRGDYAVLKALGFTRGQVASAVAWQSVTIVALALVIGVPLGAALGRSTWRVFAELIGVIDTPELPLLALVVVFLGTLIAAYLVSVGPSLAAARTRPAVALRQE